MSQTVIKIKSRIKSVTGAYKVTSAMKLVSTVKLKQWKNKMIAHKDYVKEVNDIVDLLLKYDQNNNSPFMTINERATKNLYVIISSSLGLCGSYNNNIFKLADSKINKDDDLIVLGAKGINRYQNNGFNLISGFEEYNSVENSDLVKKLTSYLLDEYQKGTYKEIYFIYTEYKNSLVFLAKEFKLLPLIKEVKEENVYPPIMEPNPKELADTIIPFYLKSVIYSKLLESEVSEQGARSNAMENATNNAKDLLDELHIEFNKARQGAITQEITEIVAASKAI